LTIKLKTERSRPNVGQGWMPFLGSERSYENITLLLTNHQIHFHEIWIGYYPFNLPIKNFFDTRPEKYYLF